MKNVLIIFKRELSTYFASPIAYIFIIIFLLLCGTTFMLPFFVIGKVSMRQFFYWTPIVMLLFIPPITMGLWAEEKKLGTLELLMTLPMENWQIVMGKYLAAFSFFLIALSGTLTIPIMLLFLGKPDFGPIISGYLGMILGGALFLSIGIFISGLFKDQIIAFIVTLFITAVLCLAGWGFFPTLLDNFHNGLGEFAYQYIGLTRHFDDIGRGVVAIPDLFYFLSFTVLFLYLNVLSLEGRKY
jgi:ABC-type transport system involved in multi-copper enzyme maturation permease subunit